MMYDSRNRIVELAETLGALEEMDRICSKRVHLNDKAKAEMLGEIAEQIEETKKLINKLSAEIDEGVAYFEAGLNEVKEGGIFYFENNLTKGHMRAKKKGDRFYVYVTHLLDGSTCGGYWTNAKELAERYKNGQIYTYHFYLGASF